MMAETESRLNGNIEQEKSDEERQALYRMMRRDRIYCFKDTDLSSLYIVSSEFRTVVDSGKYVYVDGYIVLNSPLCLEYRDRSIHVREEVLEHLYLYCLARRRVSQRFGKAGFAPKRKTPGMCRKLAPTRYKTVYFHADQIASFQEVTAENVAGFIGTQGDLPSKFGKAIEQYMKASGTTQEKLAEMTGLSQKTIQRLCRDEDRPDIKQLVAVCVALDISQWDCLYLVRLAGYDLTYREEDRIYFNILMRTCVEGNTVYECNRMLERLGRKPLTKL